MGMCQKNKLALALAGAAGLCLSATAFGQSDSCAGATVISNGTFAYDLTGATNEGNTAAACGASGTAEDLWWSYTATADGTLTVSTCGLTGADSVLSLWNDCSGSLIACNDDICALQSTVSTTVVSGQTVLIRVADYLGGVHAGSISVVGPGGPPPPPPPPNDNCADAVAVTDGTVDFDTTQLTPDLGASCAGNGSASQWFLYNNTTGAALAVTVTTCGTASFDTVLAAFDSCGGAQYACNDDACGLQSSITFNLPVAGSAFIRISGFGVASGAGQMQISSQVPPSCELTAPIGAQIEAEDCGGDTNGGCNAGGAYETIACGNAVVFGSTWASGGTRDTDWYRFTQYSAGDVTATINAELPTGVFLLDGNCPPAFFGTAFSANALDFCRDISVTASAPAGPVVVFVSTSTATAAIFDGFPCGGTNDYILTVSTTGSCIPFGACCTSSGCSQMTEAECDDAGGTYLGDDSVCETPGGFQFTAGTAAIEDISATGTNLFLTDDSNANVALPFAFNFFGNTYNDMFVGSNGFITFGAGSNVFVNGPIPSAALPNNALYVLWDDFNPGAGGAVLTETRGTAGTDLRQIVQWDNVPQFAAADANTFQAILHENGTVEYRYGTISNVGGGDVTVGAENEDGTAATTVDDSTVVSGTSQSARFVPGFSNCPSCAWQTDGCFADYTNDDGIDGDDVIAFFADWDSNNSCADVDGSEGVDGDDVILFFSAWDVSGTGLPGC